MCSIAWKKLTKGVAISFLVWLIIFSFGGCRSRNTKLAEAISALENATSFTFNGTITLGSKDKQASNPQVTFAGKYLKTKGYYLQYSLPAENSKQTIEMYIKNPQEAYVHEDKNWRKLTLADLGYYRGTSAAQFPGSFIAEIKQHLQKARLVKKEKVKVYKISLSEEEIEKTLLGLITKDIQDPVKRQSYAATLKEMDISITYYIYVRDSDKTVTRIERELTSRYRRNMPEEKEKISFNFTNFNRALTFPQIPVTN